MFYLFHLKQAVVASLVRFASAFAFKVPFYSFTFLQWLERERACVCVCVCVCLFGCAYSCVCVWMVVGVCVCECD